jgi:hypothetical protein
LLHDGRPKSAQVSLRGRSTHAVPRAPAGFVNRKRPGDAAPDAMTKPDGDGEVISWQVALVTGASGIARAAVEASAEAGVAVALVAEKTELLIAMSRKNAFIGRAVSKTVNRFGRIDILQERSSAQLR